MKSYYPEDITLFKKKALEWAASFDTACFFDSNSFSDAYSAFDQLIAVDTDEQLIEEPGSAFDKLDKFLKISSAWAVGYLGYDLKNETDGLSSSNPDYLEFPSMYFFKPLYLILIKGKKVEIISPDPDVVFNIILGIEEKYTSLPFRGVIQQRTSAAKYHATVSHLIEHIRRGDIYEVNFCQEFYSEDCLLHPLSAFKSLNSISPTPFAVFFKFSGKYIIGASPERFLCKRSSKLISQPIKGTIKRSPDPEEDMALKEILRTNKKEQAENVMIVDLVRNDLTKIAIPGTVMVEELFGMYTFEQVHQMISTIVCEVSPDKSPGSIIKEIFPMGSMTGAPKISAMKLIDEAESSKRGAFSGAVGYFSPDGNFDFNVIIRTILYNSSSNYLSFEVGSAITFESNPQKEYEECLLKAEAIFTVLSKVADA